MGYTENGLQLKNDAIKNMVQEILKKTETYKSKAILQQIYGFIDLTSLNVWDTNEDIRQKLVNRVNVFENDRGETPNVAGICVYPKFAEIVHKEVKIPEIKTVVVGASFPSSQTFVSVKMAEVELIVNKGADEVDIVLPLAEFLSGQYDKVLSEIRIIKEVVGKKHLKVILETGAYHDNYRKIYLASMLAMEGGADFIKTSTGKIPVSATPEAVYVMALAIKDFCDRTGKKIGLKPAGGISTTDVALKYYAIVKNVLGDEWLTPELFRIGASSLADKLLDDIGNVDK